MSKELFIEKSKDKCDQVHKDLKEKKVHNHFCILTFKQNPEDTKSFSTCMVNGHPDELIMDLKNAMSKDKRIGELVTKAFILYALDVANGKESYSMEEILKMANIKKED